ncbi:MAG: hypothetical protein SO238_10655 [Treponema sp.]|nr:hypothetical protein [Spirochaetia bacterium]MDY4768876.1 hypothetical protein [Treponema sp.]
MFSKKLFRSVASLLACTVIFTLSACNGDMHDDDEALKKYVVYSTQEKTLSVPAGAVFNESFEAYNVDGTYGEHKFSYIKITVDGYYVSRMVLKDSNGNQETFECGASVFTLDHDMTIKVNSSSILPIEKWNNIQVK